MNDDHSSPGIRSIYESCYALYKDQPTPPQVTAVQKFWLGGPDPLDFISMYESKGYISDGNSTVTSPPHWHYISYGLSDLYGDSRLHYQKRNSNNDNDINNDNVQHPSGFGFELTFRLKKYNEESPPLWPAMILQSLSRYLFKSQAKFVPGDHVPWNKSLEDISIGSSEKGFENTDSNIRNMIISIDPQLPRINTQYGWVDFLQIIGVCNEEIDLARKRSGLEVIERLQKYEETGGWLLVTDTRRVETLLSLDSSLDDNLIDKEKKGSTMSGVTTEVYWNGSELEIDENEESIIDVVGDGDDEKEDLIANSTPFYGISISPGSLELFPAHFPRKVRVNLSQDAAKLLVPYIIPERLNLGRHFTFHNSRSDVAVTLIPERVTGAFVSAEKTFGFRGSWLQIFLNEKSINEMKRLFSQFFDTETVTLPIEVNFETIKLVFIIEK